MQETPNGKIHKLEVTGDTLTSRGGLAFFVKYVQAIGIVDCCCTNLRASRRASKGYRCRICFCRCCISSSTAPAGT